MWEQNPSGVGISRVRWLGVRSLLLRDFDRVESLRDSERVRLPERFPASAVPLTISMVAIDVLASPLRERSTLPISSTLSFCKMSPPLKTRLFLAEAEAEYVE